jgi:hypothetical protein
VLVFPRGNGLWLYAPSTITSGDSYNISPWSQPWLRPPNARGRVTALQGSSRWMYFAVRRQSDGHTWIYRRDAATGASHTWLDLGVGNCWAMSITTIVPPDPGNPTLLIGYGTSVLSVMLPLSGDAEVDDPNVRHQLIGYLDMPDTELGFPTRTRSCSRCAWWREDGPNQRWFEGYSSTADRGSAGHGCHALPSSELMFPNGLTFRRLALRVWFRPSTATRAPNCGASRSV